MYENQNTFADPIAKAGITSLLMILKENKYQIRYAFLAQKAEWNVEYIEIASYI